MKVHDGNFRSAVVHIADSLAVLLSLTDRPEGAIPKLSEGKFPVRGRSYEVKRGIGWDSDRDVAFARFKLIPAAPVNFSVKINVATRI